VNIIHISKVQKREKNNHPIRCGICGKFISEEDLLDHDKVKLELDEDSYPEPILIYAHTRCNPKINYWLRHV
jgi:hypothetical protein